MRHFLANTDWEIVCPVTFKHKGLPERILTQIGPDREWWSRVTIVTCDLSTCINDTTMEVFGNLDHIINYASQSHVDRSIEDPSPFIRNNVDVVLNLLDLARNYPNLKSFIQVSTDEVYGPAPQGYAHAEWESIIPSNPYSASKAAQEAIAVSYWRTYNVPVVITNCMNLIGEMQDPEKFIPMLIKKISRGELVDIHASADGTVGSRFYLHARNLADAILFLINRNQVSMYHHGADRPDRWHIVGEREVDNLEMANMIAQALGKTVYGRLVDFHSSRPGHDLRYALDGQKIAEAGWKMPVPLDESLNVTVRWTIDNPIWSQR